MPSQWIQKAVPASHEGRFKRWAKAHHMSVPAAIPVALKSKNAHVRHMAQFARNMRRIAHKR